MTNFEFLERHHGLTQYAWKQLRTICRELHHRDELCCNGDVEYGDDGKTEELLERASRQAARFGLKVYHQGDPRGCSLWVYTQSSLNEALERSENLRQPGMQIRACYNNIGTAIC